MEPLSSTTPTPGTPGHPPPPKPILTKAIGSVICGLLSIPTCFCAGVPSLIFGSAAVWLGLYVQKNFRGSTASEVANIYAWVGVITGVIGIILGFVALLLGLSGSAIGLLDAAGS